MPGTGFLLLSRLIKFSSLHTYTTSPHDRCLHIVADQNRCDNLQTTARMRRLYFVLLSVLHIQATITFVGVAFLIIAQTSFYTCCTRSWSLVINNSEECGN